MSNLWREWGSAITCETKPLRVHPYYLIGPTYLNLLLLTLSINQRLNFFKCVASSYLFQFIDK